MLLPFLKIDLVCLNLKFFLELKIIFFIVSGAFSAVQIFLESVFPCDGNKSIHT